MISRHFWYRFNCIGYRWLASTFNVACVVVNQVRSSMGARALFGRSHKENVPALGLAWSHCVNTRIEISRLAQLRNTLDDKENNTENEFDRNSAIRFSRAAAIELSSCQQRDRISFQITPEGIEFCSSLTPVSAVAHVVLS